MCKTQTINLIESEYLAEGNTRRVYLHPDRDDVIIKIAKPNNMPWLKRYVRPLNRRFGPLRNEYREYEAYFAYVSQRGDLPPFLPVLKGFVKTNLGVGLMSEKISDEQGGLAPACAITLPGTGCRRRSRS